MSLNTIYMIVAIVAAVFSFIVTILNVLRNSKNKKIRQSAQTALDTLYAVRDAMFAVEDKKYTSEDKKTVAISIAKEKCREENVNCSTDGLESALDFIMEIGNTINKRTPSASVENNTKVGSIIE